MGFKLAIDGPAASGKSTISSKLAKQLGWTHIDTGSMYRAVTLLALEKKIDLENESEYSFINDIDIKYLNNKIYIDNRDVTKEIRDFVVNQNVSLVSSFASVRKKMVELQKKAAQTGNIVMDGRDIGTVVLPDADLKIFLTASVDERSKRRYKDHLNKGDNPLLTTVKSDLITRDLKDTTRQESPLKKAEDAVILDTTNLSIDEVVKKIIDLIENKGE